MELQQSQERVVSVVQRGLEALTPDDRLPSMLRMLQVARTPRPWRWQVSAEFDSLRRLIRHELRSSWVVTAAMAAMVISGRAVADADLEQKLSNSPSWAAQAGDYGNHRWSDLNEINVVNFGKLPVAWTLYGDPMTGETNINAPPVFKDKVITGRSGGEYGVRGRLNTYDIKTGRKSCTGWSVGPDSDLLVAPAETMIWSDGRMAARGKDSSLKAWQGDQWKLGAGPPWGWYSYDPKLNLGYYGTGNPGTWNSAQRSADHNWSRTVFAQDLDTDMAKCYRMTPPINGTATV